MKDRTSKQRQQDEDDGKNQGKSFSELKQEKIRQEIRGAPADDGRKTQ